jgi:fructose-bisphosphate aldolase class 1
MSIEYGELRKLQDGRYFAKATHEDGKKVYKQFNSVTLKSKLSETRNVFVDVSNHLDVFENYKNDIIRSATENSEKWFNKVLNEKTIEAAFDSPITQDEQIMVSKVYNEIPIFTHTREAVSEDELPEDTVCDVIMEFSGITFSKKHYSPMWRIAQVKLRAPPKKKVYMDYMFEDEPDQEVEEEEEIE